MLHVWLILTDDYTIGKVKGGTTPFHIFGRKASSDIAEKEIFLEWLLVPLKFYMKSFPRQNCSKWYHTHVSFAAKPICHLKHCFHILSYVLHIYMCLTNFLIYVGVKKRTVEALEHQYMLLNPASFQNHSPRILSKRGTSNLRRGIIFMSCNFCSSCTYDCDSNVEGRGE